MRVCFESNKLRSMTIIAFKKNTTDEYRHTLAKAIQKYNHIYNITSIYDLFDKKLECYSVQDLIVASNLAGKQYDKEINVHLYQS